MDKQDLQADIRHRLKCDLAKNWEDHTQRDLLTGLTLTVRDQLVQRMVDTQARYDQQDAKQVYYLSIEFLIGRSLGNNLDNLGLTGFTGRPWRIWGLISGKPRTRKATPGWAMGAWDVWPPVSSILWQPWTCRASATASITSMGFSARKFKTATRWKSRTIGSLKAGPWQIARPDEACVVLMNGRVEYAEDLEGNFNPIWLDWDEIIGVPHDIPIVGFDGKTVNYLRLYSARPSSAFDIDIFNEGDYIRAVEQKIHSETISKILYPSDIGDSGKELRLIQEYFLVACALRDIIRRYRKSHRGMEQFPDHVAIHLNDTHPALAVAELMRILVDERRLPWEQAWDLTRHTLAFTNHTLLPEALEKWQVELFRRVLPRHLQIIYEINRRFLEEVALRWPNEPGAPEQAFPGAGRPRQTGSHGQSGRGGLPFRQRGIRTPFGIAENRPLS